MANHMGDAESRVAVLVDCDNTSPEILEGGFKYEVQHGLTRRETPRGVS